MGDAIQPVPVMMRRFACPFCSRTRSARKATAEHMARCWLNPAARACKTCEHFTDEQGDSEWCWAGRPCDCNQGYQQCEAGVASVREGKLVSGCPLWQAKEGDGG